MDPTGAGAPGVVRRSRGERTRARLLDAAREAFAGVSWHRARVEDVCRVAGVGHGTFYAYYANKTAVLEALVRRHAAELYRLAESPWAQSLGVQSLGAQSPWAAEGAGDGAGEAEPAAAEVRAAVRAVIAGFVDLSVADRDIREIWYAAAPSEPDLARLVDEVREQFIRRIAGNLRAAADAATARPGVDVEIASLALVSMVDQAVVLGAERFDRDRLVDGLTDLWVHAVYR